MASVTAARWLAVPKRQIEPRPSGAVGPDHSLRRLGRSIRAVGIRAPDNSRIHAVLQPGAPFGAIGCGRYTATAGLSGTSWRQDGAHCRRKAGMICVTNEVAAFSGSTGCPQTRQSRSMLRCGVRSSATLIVGPFVPLRDPDDLSNAIKRSALRRMNRLLRHIFANSPFSLGGVVLDVDKCHRQCGFLNLPIASVPRVKHQTGL